jgi:hypothetical protein
MKLITEDWAGEYQVKSTIPEMFKWVEVDGMFMCNGAKMDGCFSTSGTITYNIQAPRIIRHEAGHAILYKLRDKRWKCFEHVEKCDISHAEYEVCRVSPTCN